MKKLRKEAEKEVKGKLRASKAQLTESILKHLDVYNRRLRAQGYTEGPDGTLLPPGAGGRAVSGGAAWRRRTIDRLRRGTAVAADPAAEEEAELKRTAARVAWVRRTCEAHRQAIAVADAAWMKLVEPYADWDDGEIPDLDPPPEQAEVDRIWQMLDDVRRLDRWPRHLHWSL